MIYYQQKSRFGLTETNLNLPLWRFFNSDFTVETLIFQYNVLSTKILVSVNWNQPKPSSWEFFQFWLHSWDPFGTQLKMINKNLCLVHLNQPKPYSLEFFQFWLHSWYPFGTQLKMTKIQVWVNCNQPKPSSLKFFQFWLHSQDPFGAQLKIFIKNPGLGSLEPT